MKRFNLIIVLLISSLSSFSQLATNLPQTFKYQAPMGVFECTINRDGSISSRLICGCTICYGSGNCRICGGTGTRFIYGGINRCMSCFGRGKCSRCQGKGYTVTQSFSQYGQTITVDENGNVYFDCLALGSAESQMSRNNSRKQRKYIEKIEYVPGFGVELVYCPKCRSKGERHIHVKRYY